MYANIYRGGEFVDTVTLDSTHILFSTEFILTYRPSYSGNYYLEFFLEDPYRPSAEFVFDASYTFTGAGPIPGEHPIDGFEADSILTFPLIIGLMGTPSAVFITLSKRGIVKKAKDKLKSLIK